MLHDAASSHVKAWRELKADWTQERLLCELYSANQSGNPPWPYLRTPRWVQQAYNVIDRCIRVDRERDAARMAAGAR